MKIRSGWRARIGFLIPSANPTVEREMYELAPEGVSVHFQRMVARGPVGTWANLQSRVASHLEHVDETVELLANVKPDVIVLAHTAPVCRSSRRSAARWWRSRRSARARSRSARRTTRRSR